MLVVVLVLVLVEGTVCRVHPRCCFPPLNSSGVAFLGTVGAFPLLLKNAPKNCLIWSGRPRANSGHARDQLVAVNRLLRLFTVGDAHGGSAAPRNCLIWSAWHFLDPGRFATW